MILGKGDMDFLKCGMPTYLTEEQYGSAVSWAAESKHGRIN